MTSLQDKAIIRMHGEIATLKTELLKERSFAKRCANSPVGQMVQYIDHLKQQLDEVREWGTFYRNTNLGTNAYKVLQGILDKADLTELAKEFDDAPENAEWKPEHPIFRLAEENGTLKREIQHLRKIMKATEQHVSKYPVGEKNA
jgi:hypothetical protein